MSESADDRLKAVMAAVLGIDVATIGRSTSAQTVASWDSLRQVQLVVTLEEEFGVTFAGERIAELNNWLAIREALSECAVT